MKDFFISYNQADLDRAEWIARQLTDAGYSVVIQSWDILPGDNFVLAMHRFASEAARTIAVLSPEYLTSIYAAPEWAAAFAHDPTGEKRTFVPVRVRECSLEGLLRQIVYIDLVGKSDAEARHALLEGIERPIRTDPAAPSSERLWNVPYRRNPFFTGRDQVLKGLHKVLSKGSKAALTQVAAIAGLGGIGKTQTAVEYAYRYRNDYKAVFWVRAESDSSTTSGFLEIAGMLNLAVKDAQESVQAVMRWLGSNAGWLLIFDNADEPEKLKPFLPTDPKGHTLITSRAQVFHGLAQPVRLEALAPERALEFLLKRTEREASDGDEREAAAHLAKELGYLPLALEQAGAFISENGSRFGDYLSSYRKQRLELLNRARPIAGDYKESVATTWLMNFTQIESASPASADLLRISAFLDPDSIPLTLIIQARKQLGPLLSAALAGADQDRLILDTLLQPLMSYSLIRKEPGSESYSVHRMVQEAVEGWMDEARRRAWAERAVLAVSEKFPDPEYATWPLCELLLPHAGAAPKLIDEWNIEPTQAARLLNNVGLYNKKRGKYAEAEPLYKRALGIYERAVGPDHPDVATGLNNLATLYEAQGRYEEAEPLYKRALGIYEKAVGPDHPNVARSLNNLAELYRVEGRYEEAEPLYSRALALKEKALGPDHPYVATGLNNLATLYEAQGRYEEAEPLYKRALGISEKALGPDHPDVAISFSNLASLYYGQGKYGEAGPLYDQALGIWEKAIGPDHPYVATSLNNLALLYEAQSRYEEAEPLYSRALLIFEKALGPDHPHAVKCRNNLRLFYEKQGPTGPSA
jgi:tetratricopeptide (TPR) repeat protein